MSLSNENLIISKEKNETPKKEVPLLYYFKNNVTSQDPSFPLNNLLNKTNKRGWISNRFCTYPQEIIVEFHSYVNIKQINILINESKIPTIIEIINCMLLPTNNNNNSKILRLKNNKLDYQYKNIGFIKLSPNIETNFKARELRKIYINILTKRIKLIIHKNYSNTVNTFCQVGIVSLDFFGYILNNDKNNENNNKKLNYADLYIDEEIEGINDSFFEEKMDKYTEERIKELTKEMEKKKECEEYDDCKIIKKEIDQLKKITYKIYNLEMYKKECVQRNDFDNAKKIKRDIDIFKKMLYDYLNNTDNYQNENQSQSQKENLNNKNEEIKVTNEESKLNNDKTNNNIKISKKLKTSRTQQNIFNFNEQNIDNLILPTLQKKKNNNLNSISNINSNSFDNNNTINTSGHYDSIIGINENEQKEREPLEEISNEIKSKYEILDKLLGEETLQKLFSKQIYYKEEGLDILTSKANNIIVDSQKTTKEANKYIVSLINIFFRFFDEKHPTIICKCLDLFLNILKSIKERSSSNKTEYDFKITKPLLTKIIGKLNHISKKVRLKAAELYCYMLDSDFCEYNSLITELVENEVTGYYNKLEILNNNNLNYNYQINTSRGQLIVGNNLNLSKQLIITKMKIFLDIFSKYDKNIENKKFDVKKFPQSIVGDFIIINLNHPKEEVRDITKDVLIKYIKIFGNQILYKLRANNVDKELLKLFQDKEELKQRLLNIREEENKKNISKINNLNYLYYLSGPKNKSQKLTPIVGNNFNNNSSMNTNNKMSNNQSNINGNNKKLMKSASQPKYLISNKIKLKPINNKQNAILNNSNISQNNIVSNNKINNIKNDKKEDSKNQEKS